MFGSHNKDKRKLIAKVLHHEENTNPPSSGDKAFNMRLWRNIFIGVIFAIITITIGINIYYYNLFVNIRQEVREVRANVETTLQLRENMVPAIMTTITEFIIHENEIFIHAADVRAKSLENRPQPSESAPGQSGEPMPPDDWDKLLSELFAVAENYPDIKTGEPFQLLMSKIADAELEILNKRVLYNEKVRNFNVRISTFPATFFSYIFKVETEPYFQWKGKPEWVSTLDEDTRKRTDEILEKWRSRVMDE